MYPICYLPKEDDTVESSTIISFSMNSRKCKPRGPKGRRLPHV